MREEERCRKKEDAGRGIVAKGGKEQNMSKKAVMREKVAE